MTRRKHLQEEEAPHDEEGITLELHIDAVHSLIATSAQSKPQAKSKNMLYSTATVITKQSAITPMRYAQTCATAQWGRCKVQGAQGPLAGTPATAYSNVPAMIATSVSLKVFSSKFAIVSEDTKKGASREIHDKPEQKWLVTD